MEELQLTSEPGPWHSRERADVLATLDSRESGLGQAEAAARLGRVGPNALPRQPAPTWLYILVRQFLSPLIYVLAAAAVVSLAIGETMDAAFIVAVLLLNALIGAYQEWRAERSSRALQQLLRVAATVVRDGEICDIDAEDVVPGDVVLLESGNRVPADVRLLWEIGLETDESLLTGESVPVSKEAVWTGSESTPLADRRNMAYAGTIVARGRARAVAVATGAATAVGQVAMDVLRTPGGKPPLLVRMERFARAVALAVLISTFFIGLIGVAHGYSLLEMFLFAVALAVSAIPEGLPVAMTIALAVATSRMARRGVVVRRLATVEGLGSCTLIASDKTGTLTCNELTAREVLVADGRTFTVTGEGFAPEGAVLRDGHVMQPGSEPLLDALARVAVLCNEAELHRRDGRWTWRGDPTEVALLALAHKMEWGRERALELHREVNRIPFEAERRFAASYHRVGEEVGVFVKGAPEQVLAMCAPEEGLAAWYETAERLAENGCRVLAFADGPGPPDLDASRAPPEPGGLRFLGLVAMIDPLRPGVREAVRACHAAGIDVALVTGDHPATALAIARDLGLASDPGDVVSGAALDEIGPDELPAVVARTRVFARVTPRQKLDIVESARAAGHFVAVTGDGVNDAPALRAAHIGVAMGKSGTDVARENADLVISDDNFATIVAGIEEGRIAYDNVRKVIYLLVSTGAAELVLMTLALAAGMPLPLLPVQLLWLNLVTNGIQDVALAFEPGEGGELARPPRPPGERIFDRLMIERTLIAAVVIGGVTFGSFRWMLENGWSESTARSTILLLMVLFENIHVGNCRSETRSAFELSPLRSPLLLAGTMTAQLVHIAMLYLPAGRVLLGTEPVDLATWTVLLCLALSVVVALELHKRALRWRKASAS